MQNAFKFFFLAVQQIALNEIRRSFEKSIYKISASGVVQKCLSKLSAAFNNPPFVETSQKDGIVCTFRQYDMYQRQLKIFKINMTFNNPFSWIRIEFLSRSISWHTASEHKYLSCDTLHNLISTHNRHLTMPLHTGNDTALT